MFSENGLDSYIHSNGSFCFTARDFGDDNLQIVKRKPPLPVRTSRGTVLVPANPFDDVAERIAHFFSYQKPRSVFARAAKIALITPQAGSSEVDFRGFAARGLSERDVTFVECESSEKALRAVCDDGRFQIVVVAAPASRRGLRIARNWLHQREGPSASAFAMRPKASGDRMVLFVE